MSATSCSTRSPSAGNCRGIIVRPDFTLQIWRGQNTFQLSCVFHHFSLLLLSASLTFLHAPHLSLYFCSTWVCRLNVAEVLSPLSPAWRMTRSTATLPGVTRGRRHHSSPPICPAILSKHFLAETVNFDFHKIVFCLLDGWCWPAFRDLTMCDPPTFSLGHGLLSWFSFLTATGVELLHSQLQTLFQWPTASYFSLQSRDLSP